MGRTLILLYVSKLWRSIELLVSAVWGEKACWLCRLITELIKGSAMNWRQSEENEVKENVE